MFECRKLEEFGLKWICLEGRIDAISATDVHNALNEIIEDGERSIGVDFEKVNYISSAGLRVFLVAQKRLGKVGGEIILAAMPPNILEIFKMSGFDGLFQIKETRKGVGSAFTTSAEPSEIVSIEKEGIDIRYLNKQSGRCPLRIFGDQKKLSSSAYNKGDVIGVSSKDVAFGVGLGTLGDEYEQYKHFFGEAMIINRHFFFYPAIKNPVVDYMFCSREETVLEYNLLHGFGFDGSLQYAVSFEVTDGFIELGDLVNTFFDVSRADLLGIVILGESKGVWGMHLKKVPIVENGPENGKNIFESENFSDWLSFPVGPDDINHVVAGTGIAMRHKDTGPAAVREIMAAESNFHFHGGVFAKTLISKRLEHFEDELQRVLTELDVYKVQHMLGKTRFSSGMAGIFELEG